MHIINFLHLKIGIIPDQIPRLYSKKTITNNSKFFINLTNYVKEKEKSQSILMGIFRYESD